MMAACSMKARRVSGWRALGSRHQRWAMYVAMAVKPARQHADRAATPESRQGRRDELQPTTQHAVS